MRLQTGNVSQRIILNTTDRITIGNEDTSNEPLTPKKTDIVASVTSKDGVTPTKGCGCTTTNCQTKRCGCKKRGEECTEHCHKGTNCSNK